MTDETAPVATAPAAAVPADIPAPAPVVAAAPPAAPAAAPAAPGPDVVVPSAPAAPVPTAPPPVGSDAAGTTAPAAAPATPCAAFRAWEASRLAAIRAAVSTWNLAKCVNDLLTGFRMLIVFGVTLVLGLLDSLNSLDITGTITSHYPNLRVGDVTVALSATAIALRAITRTPLFQSWKTGRSTIGSVDEPN